MSTKIIFPKIGFSMDEGTLVQWAAADGAEIREGDPLYTLESDKSVMDIEAPASGRLRITAPAGATYAVGAELGEIV